MTTVAAEQQQPVRSTIPARLDRLRWSPFHTRLVLVLGLGTAWLLDGLEITIASSVSGKLTAANTLSLSTTQASAIGTIYRRRRQITRESGPAAHRGGRSHPGMCLGRDQHRERRPAGRSR